MKKYLTFFIFLAFVVLSGCQPGAAINQETIEETTFDQVITPKPAVAEIDPIANEKSDEGCIISGCGEGTCSKYDNNRSCSFSAYDICTKEAHCKKAERRCQWEETPEYLDCRKKVKLEIAEVNDRFRANRASCRSDEWCTYEYRFREDHFDFIAPAQDWVEFYGGDISFSYVCPEGDPCALNNEIRILYEEPTLDPTIDRNIEEIQADGAAGVKYEYTAWLEAPVDTECAGYYLRYKDKFYEFKQHEGCMWFGDEFSDSLKFYEN